MYSSYAFALFELLNTAMMSTLSKTAKVITSRQHPSVSRLFEEPPFTTTVLFKLILAKEHC